MFAAKNELFTPSSTGYRISRSLRFRSSASAYLNRTFSTSRTLNTKGTFSVWVKRGALGADSFIFGGYDGSSTGATALQFKTNNTLMFDFGGSAANSTTTTQVFRDVGAFYHIVLAIDTTSATTTITGSSTDRVRLYVNGTQVSAFSGTSVPTQHSNWMFALNTANNKIGTVWNNTGGFFDGYLADVNFIDGQALTPSSFGAYDTTTGVWQPARYTGTYGNNGFYLPFSATATSTFAGSFNGTQYLTTATNAGLGLGTSDFTVEYWMNTTTATNGTTLCCAGTGTVSFDGLFGYITSGSLVLYLTSTPGVWDVASNRTIISSITTGRWYHIAFTRSGSTWRVFVDGTQVDTFTSSASLYQSGNQFTLARAQGTGIFTGLLSNVRVIKGTALYTSNFTPSASPLTAVTNTQLLTLQNATIVDNSANALTITNTGSVTTSAATPWSNYIAGQDSSGAGNNWASANINVTSSGTTYDSVIDSPTNYADGGNGRGNYAVLNPLDKNSSTTITDANLSNYASTTAWQGARASIAINSGKWYIEGDITNHGTAYAIGFANSSWGLGQTAGDANASGIYWDGSSTSYYWFTTTVTNAGFTPVTGNSFVMAIDMDAGKVWLGYKTSSTTWLGGGNPATGTTPTFTFTPNITLYPCISTYNTTQRIAINFGQRPFSGTIPSGYSALNTQNLPTPTIANGAQYMAATTYIGTSASNPISNGSNNTLGTTFQPDFVWLKNRNYASGTNHVLIDSVRGISNGLASNLTNGDFSTTGNFSSINPTGFTVAGTARDYNFLNDTFVGWQWKAGGTPTVNNTAGAGNVPTAGSVLINGANSTSALAGSIAATRLSANTSAGFSVVTYTGNGTAGATVGHGLGVAPSMIIVKRRDAAAAWDVYHVSIGATGRLYLNTTDSTDTSSAPWNNAAPDSSKFTVGTATDTNNNGSTIVAYCFANVSGYSSAFSYTGNGSSDGPMVYLNFRPRWILAKRTDTTGDWWIIDTSRDTYNVSQNGLNPNLSNAESTGWYVDVLSNGFKIRVAGTGTSMNASGGTYIGYAIAENPFSISRAR